MTTRHQSGTASPGPALVGRLPLARVHHFTANPERLRLMSWGQLQLGPDDTPTDDPMPDSTHHKIDQIRETQQAGHLDPGWDPMDILTFVSQIATSWAAAEGMLGTTGDRETLLAARRAAIVAVERLFPASAPGQA